MVFTYKESVIRQIIQNTILYSTVYILNRKTKGQKSFLLRYCIFNLKLALLSQNSEHKKKTVLTIVVDFFKLNIMVKDLSRYHSRLLINLPINFFANIHLSVDFSFKWRCVLLVDLFALYDLAVLHSVFSHETRLWLLSFDGKLTRCTWKYAIHMLW
jgi:hypothetical protein